MNRKMLAAVVVFLLASATAFSQDSVDVTFRYLPSNTSPSVVFLPGEFNQWGPNSNGVISQNAPSRMTQDPLTGVWTKTVRLQIGYLGGVVPGAYEYKFNEGGTTWLSDPLNPMTNANDQNDSYLYIRNPTIYQLIPNEKTFAVASTTPTISAYLFPKVGAAVDTSTITLKVGARFYSGLGRYYNATTNQFSFPMADRLPNGIHNVILSAGSSADTVSITVQAGYVQITNLSGFITRNPQRILYGVVQDAAIHSIRIVRNDVDTLSVTASLGNFVDTVQLREGLNTFKAVTRDTNNTLQVSDPISFTYLVNHAPDANIYFIGAGPSVIFNAQGIDPDSGQVATFLWSQDSRNPQQIAGVDGSKSQQFSVPKPTVPGEYYFTLIASDPDGNKDTTRSFFTILDGGIFQGSSLATVPQWVKQGRLYEMFFKSFTSQGTINAAIPMLPYLKSLGVNILWVMPIMENAAPINNRTGPGYNIKNFLKVAPEYGTNDDFKNFVTQAHALGLKIIVDITPNHTSYQHPFVLEARQYRERSPYWSFYQHTIIPHNTNGLGQTMTSDGFVYYTGFSDQLLNYNWSDVDARAYMIEVYKWWVRDCDIDGYRFDVYWGPHRRAGGGAGNELEMGAPVRKALKKLKPDIFLLAEDDGTGSGTEVIFGDRSGGVDAGYDWNLYGGAIKPFFFDVGSIENLHTKYFNNNFYPGPNASFMRFMENHDEERIIYQYQDSTYQKTMPVATTIFTVPGMPMIYSGQEVGYGLTVSDFYQRTRGVIDWKAAGRNILLPHYQRLTNIRSQFAAFSTQKFVRLTSGNGLVYAYARPQNGVAGIVAVNFSSTPQDVTLSLSSSVIDSTLQDGKSYVLSDLYSDSSFTVKFSGGAASIRLSLKAYGSSVCVLADSVKRLNLPVLVSVKRDLAASLPTNFILHQNYPNPFNPTTRIAYDLPSQSYVMLRVFNILGEEVASLAQGKQEQGRHVVQWNGVAASGLSCSSGVYFLRLEAGNNVSVKRMMLLK
ncbi:MAG: alpha-amylase family glycosyl hydrolase [Bacteroidota bacterium]